MINKQIIKRIVLDEFGVDEEYILQKTRDREVVTVRQYLAFFLNGYTNESLASIGREINLHHTSIVYHCKIVHDQISIDSLFYKKSFYSIEDKIKDVILNNESVGGSSIALLISRIANTSISKKMTKIELFNELELIIKEARSLNKIKNG